MRVYVMDSDYEVMKQLEGLINSNPKYSAKCFTSLQLLLESARNVPPDIVLVDVDSGNAAASVKAIQAANPELKIVIMSQDREKVSECFKLNADGFLGKPIDEEKLKEQLIRATNPLLARIKYGSEGTARL